MLRGTIAIALLGAVVETIASAKHLYEFSIKERRARWLFVCGGGECLIETRSLLGGCDTALTALSTKLSSPLETLLTAPGAAILLRSLSPSSRIEQLRAHIAYHKGGLCLLADDPSEAEIHLERSLALWSSALTSADALLRSQRDENEYLTSLSRAHSRAGDCKARIRAREAAMEQYSAATRRLGIAGTFMRIRISNNMAIANFADGRDDPSIEAMRAVVEQADKYVKPCGLSPTDANSFDEAMRVWLQSAVAAQSMVAGYKGLGTQDKQPLLCMAKAFRDDAVDTLVESILFGDREDHIVVEALERAKLGCRKAFTARLNVVTMLALAERGANDIVAALSSVLDQCEATDDRVEALRALLALDRQWIPRAGVARTKLALGSGLARLLEVGALDGDVKSTADRLAKQWLADASDEGSQGQMGAASLWQARRAYAAGDVAGGRHHSIVAVNLLRHRRTAIEAAQDLADPKKRVLADSPREVRLEATALVVQARNPSKPRNSDLPGHVDEDPATVAAKLLFDRGLDDKMSHPVTLWANDAAHVAARRKAGAKGDAMACSLTKEQLDALEALVKTLEAVKPPSTLPTW